jgi:predicted cupin superfamily sugar epimerase
MDPKTLAETLNLLPHPEGGYYRETYRSPSSTAIYFLLTKGNPSHFHRIKSDELWHFHKGDPIEVIEIDEAGQIVVTTLGLDVYQHCVPAGRWFGSQTTGEDSLVSCTVAPPVEFETFELATRDDMLDSYPNHKEWIERLTRA